MISLLGDSVVAGLLVPLTTDLVSVCPWVPRFRTPLLIALSVTSLQMKIGPLRLTWRVWLTVRVLVVGPYYGLQRTMALVWARPSFMLLVPRSISTSGILLDRKCRMGWVWLVAPLLRWVQVTLCLLRLCLTRLSTSANRENSRMVWFLLISAGRNLSRVLCPVDLTVFWVLLLSRVGL